MSDTQTATPQGQDPAGNANGEGQKKPEDNNNSDTGGQSQAEPKTYTQEELDKLLQAEADKRVTEALKTAKGKWDKEKTAEIDAAVEKAIARARMTEEERLKAEQREALDKFNAEKAKFERDKLELAAQEALALKGLPMDFASFVIGTDEDETTKNIEKLTKNYNARIQAGVEDRLKSKPPKGGKTDPPDDPFIQGFLGK